MQDYIARMKTEQKELDDRIRKLSYFLKDRETTLNDKQKELMSNQLEAMRVYSSILEERINLELKINALNEV